MSDPNIIPVRPRTFSEWLGEYWQFIIGVVTAIGFVIATLATWIKTAEDRRMEAEKLALTRAFEARKPFLERRLAVHVETTKIIGALVSTDRASEGWKAALARLHSLRSSELPAVTTREVLTQLDLFAAELEKFSAKPTNDGLEGLRRTARIVSLIIGEVINDKWNGSDAIPWMIEDLEKRTKGIKSN